MLILSIISIALGLSVMIIAQSVGTGFQKAIKEKVSGFDAHIQISRFDFNDSYELSPIDRNQNFVAVIRKMPEISSISPFIIKGGIATGNGLIQGIMFKGVDKDFDSKQFKTWLIQGKIPVFNKNSAQNEILISKSIANKLQLSVNQKIIVYFVDEPPKIRQFIIRGIYHSGMEEFDERYILGDMRHLQKINAWNDSEVAGFDVNLKNYSDKELDRIADKIYSEIPYDVKAMTIKQRYPYIIDWLNLLDNNVFFILGLMMLIAGITMISTLLILILEQTNMIGIMKAMGASNFSIQKIFIYQSVIIISRGLLLGNSIGIGFIVLQHFFSLIPLNPEHYYMDTVPVNFDFYSIVLINASSIVACVLMMLLPSRIISGIQPVKAIKFE